MLPPGDLMLWEREKSIVAEQLAALSLSSYSWHESLAVTPRLQAQPYLVI